MAEPADPQRDVIPVREEERFDVDKVTGWIAGRLEGSDAPLEVAQFGGGHANLTYCLRFGSGEKAREYVLRRPPLGPVAPGSHDMHREFRALSVLWRASGARAWWCAARCPRSSAAAATRMPTASSPRW
jgi:aminoglycoside phosphotransferase (APT) family kinase protein